MRSFNGINERILNLFKYYNVQNLTLTLLFLRLVPMDVWEEEPIEKMEHRTVMEELTLPQVRALYPFNDHGLHMQKGEVMILLSKTSPEWWSVRKSNGTDGFAPANYVVEIEPRIMQIPVKKAEKVRSVQRVKKTKMVKQKVPVRVRRPSVPTKRKLDDSNSVPKRLRKINDTYQQLLELAAGRHALLEDAIRLFRFHRECDDFEKWIKDKEKLLANDDPKENIVQAKRLYEVHNATNFKNGFRKNQNLGLIAEVCHGFIREQQTHGGSGRGSEANREREPFANRQSESSLPESSNGLGQAQQVEGSKGTQPGRYLTTAKVAQSS